MPRQGRYLYPVALDAEPQLVAAGEEVADDEIGRFRWSSPRCKPRLPRELCRTEVRFRRTIAGLPRFTPREAGDDQGT